ncbi:cytochrome P450 monooxygenase pc-1 [Schizopora paradoxa]|uniref:Cytochrome P450 monooxygenase pc-1 n=1 Tax=Schizopora paradoxa TaxID=27342 RepID=A0A0H2S7D1_9AGAM|nr:cytochrome P450 monooxygenase pc-1 [Schizopora paradoxa]
MAPPPGIVFLRAKLPRLLGPTIALALLRVVANKYLDAKLPIPGWLQNLLLIASVPGFFALRVYWGWYRTLREARLAGAALPPTIPSKRPGGIDLLKSMAGGNLLAEFLTKHSKELGHTYNFRALFENRIFTTEPEHMKQILATEFTNWEKGDIFKSIFQPLLGNGVFNSDGEMWKFHRSMTRPFFSKARISHFELFGRHSDIAIALMKERFKSGHSIDFQDLIARFTLDSATEFLFSKNMHALSAGLPYSPLVSSSDATPLGDDFATKFSNAFSLAQEKTAGRSRYGASWPLFNFWGVRTKDSMDIINAFIDPIMREAVAKKKENSKQIRSESAVDSDADEGESFLDNLVKHTEDPILLRDEILNIMIAGRDTTASTLTFAVYCLAMYPEILARLRQEVLTKVGTERHPTYDDLRDMKYLRAVINETLRLYPPVPFNSRCSVNATTLPNNKPGAKPFFMPAKTRCLYSVLLMHRRKDLWGPDADLFDPDRFLDSRLQTYLTPNPFIFLPFNAGPRICLGQQFAYNEISFMLVRLLQSFDGISLAADEQPEEARPPPEWSETDDRWSMERIRPKVHLTLHAQGGLWVRMSEAAPSEVA